MNLTIEQIAIFLLAVALVIAVVFFVLLLLRRPRAEGDSPELRESEQARVRLETENAGLARQMTQIREQLATRERELENLTRELRDVTAACGVASERVAALTDQRDDATRKSTNAADETSRLRQTVAELNAAAGALNERFAEARQQNVELDAQLHAYSTENKELRDRNSTLAAQLDAATEKLASHVRDVEEIRAKSHLEFENIANKILELKSEKFTATNRENIEQILTPLKKDIGDFKAKVEEVYHTESKERSMLDERVKQLVEKTDQVSAEANNLASALKGQVKTQGNWGEMILERVLEASGLERGREFTVQHPIKGEDGNQQFLDVVVHLPDNRKLIIDSKVTLRAYERYCATDDAGEKAAFLKEHVTALANHVDQLSAKRYSAMDDSADFVMLFVPIEPAYLTAIQNDDSLWTRAYSKKIIMISPTNLMAVVRLVENLWERDKQDQNARQIAEQGGKLYDKFVSFLTSMDAVGAGLAKSQSAYDKALGQLRDGNGNLIRSAEKMRKLGAKATKRLPVSMANYDADPAELTENAIDVAVTADEELPS